MASKKNSLTKLILTPITLHTRADYLDSIDVSMETIKSCKVKYIATHTQVDGEKIDEKNGIHDLATARSSKYSHRSTIRLCDTVFLIKKTIPQKSKDDLDTLKSI